MEFLKEFFYFLLKGKARAEVKTVQVRQSEIEAAHAEFVRNIDELIDSQPIPLAPPPPPFITYEAKLDDPKHKPVYQLSPAQADRLQVSAKIGDVAWAIPQPRPNDDKELEEGLNQLNQEIADLKGLGMVKDVSDHFPSKIAQAMKIHGRHVRYYAPTSLTFQLFATKEYYREDGEDEYKVRERIVQ